MYWMLSGAGPSSSWLPLLTSAGAVHVVAFGPVKTVRLAQTMVGGKLVGHGRYVSAVLVTPALPKMSLPWPPAMKIRPSGNSTDPAVVRDLLMELSCVQM